MITRKIKVVYHNKNYKFAQHGNWIDLATAQVVNINPDEFKYINLGVSIALPNHYEANMLPRSSTFKKHGILMGNSEGIIDTTYRGMNDVWMFPALAHKSQVMIGKNVRIAQFKVVLSMNAPWYIKILDLFTKFKFVEVDILTNKNRGGLGSTGEK